MSGKTTVAETLKSLQQALEESFGAKLVSVVHYGDLVKKDLSQIAAVDATIRVLIVAKDLVEADWCKLSQAFDRLKGRASVAPMLMSDKELKSSTDVFPILFQEMKDSHRTLFGEDLLVDLEIKRSHVRLRCEQELKSLQLRMQSICLMHFASPHRLRTALVQDYESFLPLLKVAIKLSETPAETEIELIDIAASKFELKPKPLHEAREFAAGTGTFDEESFGHQYVELMSAVRSAAEYVDQLPDA